MLTLLLLGNRSGALSMLYNLNSALALFGISTLSRHSGFPLIVMAAINQDQVETSEPQPPLLDYACTQWRASSQSVADLYHSGAKLWKKSDLKDIERQLEQSYDLNRFTLRAIDDREVQIKNPMFGVERPIW